MTKILIDLATAQQALVTLENVNPSLVCEMAHHPKKDQHGIGQKCPLEIRHLETITAIKEVLAQPVQPVQEPTPWRDMIVVTLVREGINKHKARELADHFAAQPVQEPVGEVVEVNNDGFKCEFSQLLAIGTKLYIAPPAPQRPWVALTEQDMPSGKNPMFDHKYFIGGMVYAAKVLQEKNNAAPVAQPEQQAEPVACRFCFSKKGCWTWQCYHCGEIDDVQQPAPMPVQPKRQPLTVEEIGKAWSIANGEHNASAAVKRRITRAIEATHNIKENT